MKYQAVCLTTWRLFQSSSLILFPPVLLPDRRLRPADLGEICGAARNKGAFYSCLFSYCVLFHSPFLVSLISDFSPCHLSCYSVFCYRCVCVFFLFNSFLFDRGGGGTCPSLLSSPSLLLHPLFSSSAVYFSGEYSVGRTFLPVSPQCTSAHPQ